MNHEHLDTHEQYPGGHSHHVVGPRVLFSVFAALMILMTITIVVAFFPLGYFNLPVALAIAVIKTTLIMLFFMEVKYGSRLLWVFASTSFLFLLIMFVFTMNDYLTRTWYPTAVQ
jgi:cytochrome c oxidase subunit 4